MSDPTNFVIKRIGTYELSGTRLGKGNFAFVELATNRVTKSKVAVKVIDTRKIKDEYVKRNILREALLLKKVHHPNIVKLYETLKQRGVYCLVTEYIPGGELLALIRAHHDSRLTEAQARPIVRQIVSALHHLHAQGIVHRDLKMENILLDETKKNVKIVDFGLSNICRGGEPLKTQCGSPEYAAPELFKKGCRYGTEVDIWSVGIITFGMVVGKLPFRTPHSGARGRNDLVDQMSRGLNAIHSKYMAHLSAECRDLLRKLLEPNPQLRLPLLDVMVHPWLTAKGSWPLVPYMAPEINPQIINKVLDKVSALTKMPKSKIEAQVSRNRYDTLSGIYHLILDDELRQAIEQDKTQAKCRKERHVAWSNKRMSVDSGQSQGPDGVIKVCIKHGATKHEQAKAEESPEHSGTMATEITTVNKDHGERMWARVDADRASKASSPLDSLQIRGMKMCQVEPQRKRCSSSRQRSNSAERIGAKISTQEHRHRSASVPSGIRPSSVRPCLKQSTADHGNVISEEIHGKKMGLSPRPENVPNSGITDDAHEQNKDLAEECQQEGTIAENPDVQSIKEPVKDAPNKIVVARETHTPAMVSNMVFTERASEQIQRRPTKYPRHLRSAPKCHAQMKSHGDTGVTQAVQSPDTRSTDADTSGYKWSEHRKVYSQSAKTSRPRKLGDVTHVGKSERDLAEAIIAAEGGKDRITDNMYAIYQRYLANCKPHHKRLSIMQAQEILQHDYKFHAKYGRKSSPDVGEKDEKSGGEDRQRNDSGKMQTKGVHREKRHQSSVRTSAIRGVTLQEEQRELVLHAAQCSWMKHAIQDGGFLNKESDSKATKTQDNTYPTGEGKGRLGAKQEESLKKQKKKELCEEVEREQKRIDKELQDTERVKLIEHYLHDIYTKYGVNTTTLQMDSKVPEKDHPQRCYKSTRKGKLYSWLPRKRSRPSNELTKTLVTNPATILNGNSKGNPQSDKKIKFKDQGPPKNNSNNNIRYFNEWSKTAFINYVNSEGEFCVNEDDQDLSLQLQLKDASYWLQRHLSGVVAKSSTKSTSSEPPNHTSSRQA